MSQQPHNIKSRNTSSVEAKPKKSKAFKIFTSVAIVIISILVIIAIVLTVLVIKGRNAALSGNVDAGKNIQVPSGFDVDSKSESESIVYYDGKKYKYNDKVTTIMFAGIDKRSDEYDDEVLGDGGRADCIFVLALNTETGKYKLMAVSRETMVDVNTYHAQGDYYGTVTEQICLAHTEGTGKEDSCENLKKAVSRLFFGIPVNSYAVIDLDAISVLNEAVGGVNVTVNDDLSDKDPELYKGNNVTLHGDQAEIFVRTRDIHKDEFQNNVRMERQKVFLTSFIKQVLEMTKEDISTPLNIYNSVSDYMVTDIDAASITYYSSIFLKSGFSAEENMLKVPGETVMGEKYSEYYVDTDEFFKIILDTYYTEI